MKTLVTLVALSVVCAALIPATAVAENGPISGSFTVTYTSAELPALCNQPNNVYVEAHGIGNSTGALGTMFLTIRKCYDYVAGTYNGSFTLRSPDSRDTVTGTYAGSDDAPVGDIPGVFYPFHGVLTATGGTGKFRGASGTLKFTAIAAARDMVNGIAYYAIESNVH